MNSDRIRQIQETTAYPESQSVLLALNQVWNECQQDHNKTMADKEKRYSGIYHNQSQTIGELIDENVKQAREIYRFETIMMLMENLYTEEFDSVVNSEALIK